MNPQSLRRRRLMLEIALVLMIKLTALSMIWHVWFSDAEGRRIDAERVRARMYSTYSATGGSAAASVANEAASVGDSSPAMQ